MGRRKGAFILSLIALAVLAICAPVSSALADPGKITAIEVNPQTPSTVYVATTQAGVLKTTDNGATWSAKNAGLPTKIIYDLAVDPFAPHNIYIATGSGAFRSENNGDSWTATQPGMICTVVTPDYYNPGTIYLGTENNGVFISTNYGGTWKLTEDSNNGQVNGIAVQKTAVEPTLNPSADGDDDGLDNPNDKITPTTLLKVTPQGVFYAEYSIMGLVSWKKLKVTVGYIYSILDDMGREDTKEYPYFYVGLHQSGIYYGAPNVKHAGWNKVETPNPNANINGMARAHQNQTQGSSYAPSASNEQVVYAASFDGYVMRGVGDGESFAWNTILDAGILGVAEVYPRVVRTVALYGENGAVQSPPPLWVGTFDYKQPGAVYYSPDGGATWNNVLAGGWSE
jgi:hypothetical protein